MVSLRRPLLVDMGWYGRGPVAVRASSWAVRVVGDATHSSGVMVVMVTRRPNLLDVVALPWPGCEAHFGGGVDQRDSFGFVCRTGRGQGTGYGLVRRTFDNGGDSSKERGFLGQPGWEGRADYISRASRTAYRVSDDASQERDRVRSMKCNRTSISMGLKAGLSTVDLKRSNPEFRALSPGSLATEPMYSQPSSDKVAATVG